MMRSRPGVLVALIVLGLGACAPASPAAAPNAANPAPAGAGTGTERTLVAAVRLEPPSLLPRSLSSAAFGSAAVVQRLPNAGLSMVDGDGTLHPYLAEALPALDTASWAVEIGRA